MAERIFMIALSPTMEEGSILKWLIKEGETVQSGDILCEVETDKASMDYESSQNGTLLKILIDEGISAKVGDTIAILGVAGEDFSELLTSDVKKSGEKDKKTDNSEVEEAPLKKSKKLSNTGRTVASPLARKLAETKGIKLSDIKGTGPRGRIIKKDVEACKLESPETIRDFPIEFSDSDQLIPLNNIQKISAERLSDSKFSAPHFYLKSGVFLDRLLNDRSLINKTRNEKISLNAVFMKITAMALKKHRNINAGFEDNHIRLFSSVDIALAVAVEKGLTTPVVKNCEKKSLEVIDSELNDLISRAREGRLKADELGPAGFTISNLGQYDIDEFTAIINPPGSAILAIPKARKIPVVKDDNVVIATELKLTLSCDHRIIDGAAGAAFLSDLKKMMEMPLYALI